MAKPKKQFGLEIKTFAGQNHKNYLVYRTPSGSFHVFLEVDAKEAARQCGAIEEGNTRQMWKKVWKQVDGV